MSEDTEEQKRRDTKVGYYVLGAVIVALIAVAITVAAVANGARSAPPSGAATTVTAAPEPALSQTEATTRTMPPNPEILTIFEQQLERLIMNDNPAVVYTSINCTPNEAINLGPSGAGNYVCDVQPQNGTPFLGRYHWDGGSNETRLPTSE